MQKIFSILFLCCLQRTAWGGVNDGSSMSPFSDFDSSWAASCSESTITAVSYESKGECGVVFVSKTNSLRKGVSESSVSTRPVETCDGLSVHPVDSLHDLCPVGISSVLHTPQNLIAFTGLFSDVDHISKVLQKNIDDHLTVYDGSERLTAMATVRQLSDIMRQRNGRPYGIQALVLGLSSQMKLSLYTLDPSGGFRHWGIASSIGKNAMDVRKAIYKRIEHGAPDSPSTALAVAVGSLRDSLDESDFNEDLYKAWLCRVDKNACLQVGIIDKGSIGNTRHS